MFQSTWEFRARLDQSQIKLNNTFDNIKAFLRNLDKVFSTMPIWGPLFTSLYSCLFGWLLLLKPNQNPGLFKGHRCLLCYLIYNHKSQPFFFWLQFCKPFFLNFIHYFFFNLCFIKSNRLNTIKIKYSFYLTNWCNFSNFILITC